jgi:hypothetical protein
MQPHLVPCMILGSMHLTRQQLMLLHSTRMRYSCRFEVSHLTVACTDQRYQPIYIQRQLSIQVPAHPTCELPSQSSLKPILCMCYDSGAKNRFSTPPRPSASYESLTPASNPGSPALQFHSPYIPAYSASHQSLPRYSQSKSNQTGHIRWASEVDFKHKYP